MRMAATAESVLGAGACSLMGTLELAYLHDLVASSSPRFPGLGFEDQLHYHELVVRATHPKALGSIGALHGALWENERRLQHACSLLGSAVPREQRERQDHAALAQLSDAELKPTRHRKDPYFSWI